MTNANRHVMAKRLEAIIPTHDMHASPRDPSSKRMKGLILPFL